MQDDAVAERINALLVHCYLPDADAATLATFIDDYCRTLADYSYDEIDAACVAYVADPKHLDDRGRLIRPAAAKLKTICWDARELAEYRGRPRLPPPAGYDQSRSRASLVREEAHRQWRNLERGTLDDLNRIRARVQTDYDERRIGRSPKGGWEEAEAEMSDHEKAMRLAWRESPQYPKPPAQCTVRGTGQPLTEFWAMNGYSW